MDLSDNVKLHLKVEKAIGDMKIENEKFRGDLKVQSEINTKMLEGQDRLYKTIYGDGNGEKGIVIQIDRLKQAHNQSKWVTRMIAVPVVGTVVIYMIEFFKTH